MCLKGHVADQRPPTPPGYILREVRPCRALVVRSALALSTLASSALPGACVLFNKKCLIKSVKPSRSTPSFGLSDTLQRDSTKHQRRAHHSLLGLRSGGSPTWRQNIVSFKHRILREELKTFHFLATAISLLLGGFHVPQTKCV